MIPAQGEWESLPKVVDRYQLLFSGRVYVRTHAEWEKVVMGEYGVVVIVLGVVLVVRKSQWRS